MPNWCYTSYTFVGDKKEIKKLHKLMKQLENRKKPSVESAFGTTWLGCLVEALGKKWEDVWCRGWWDNLELCGNELKFTTETAWSAAEEVMKFIGEVFPSLGYFYYSEEPGMGIYETNDDTGLYYPDRYYVDLCAPDKSYMSEYFLNKEDMLASVGDTLKQPFTSEEEVERFFEEAKKENEDCYCHIHEITITG